MIKITHIKWGGGKIGIALHKLKPGDNHFVVTVKDKKGEYLHEGVFNINREEAIAEYGVSNIQEHKHLDGIWIPLYRLASMRVP